MPHPAARIRNALLCLSANLDAIATPRGYRGGDQSADYDVAFDDMRDAIRSIAAECDGMVLDYAVTDGLRERLAATEADRDARVVAVLAADAVRGKLDEVARDVVAAHAALDAAAKDATTHPGDGLPSLFQTALREGWKVWRGPDGCLRATPPHRPLTPTAPKETP